MISIDRLSRHPEHVPKLALLWQQLLGGICGQHNSLTEVEAWLNEWCNTDGLPLAFIALVDKVPVGLCSLQINDGIRPELMPWLGDLCVNPAYQSRGIAKMLIDATKQHAKDGGFDKLYLYTFDSTLPDYYQNIGWRNIGKDQANNQPVTVMDIEL